ncbi:MAG TPA: phosphopantetheine-binding protein [Candidatus Latescibacteria bacterium]|jgi:acyl carrier protein/polyketide biosynthesis acyl carrier protein|nr:phosphopantetheine-binding protein [Candidatus Latescibacterota bacterium]HJP29909.1 phosphopantetheine-binding protein [Candidatus Latescibacterota bacterium]|tara:strand:- start:751 stop:996 length:246 start_codon:yes stop_codon:yes gene_type:complete
MTKEEILNVITGLMEDNLDDIDGAIDASRSMVEYGANSLDIIEIVSCSMRELKIKVPRAELSDLENIDQLADKLLEHAQQE